MYGHFDVFDDHGCLCQSSRSNVHNCDLICLKLRYVHHESSVATVKCNLHVSKNTSNDEYFYKCCCRDLVVLFVYILLNGT